MSIDSLLEKPPTMEWFYRFLEGESSLDDMPAFDDHRFRIYFLGNNPDTKSDPNPELYLLMTPLSYELGKSIDAADLLFLTIAPTSFDVQHIDGTIEPIKKSGSSKNYLRLEGIVDGKKKNMILPFQKDEDFNFKIYSKDTLKQIGNLMNESHIVEVLQYYGSKQFITLDDLNTHKGQFFSQCNEFYSRLKQDFSDELDASELIENKNLRLRDLILQKKKIEEPHAIWRILSNIKSIFKETVIDTYFANFSESYHSQLKNSFENAWQDLPKDMERFYKPLIRSINRTADKVNYASITYKLIFNLVATCCVYKLTQHFMPESPSQILLKALIAYTFIDYAVSSLNYWYPKFKEVLKDPIKAMSPLNEGNSAAPGIIGTIRELMSPNSTYRRKDNSC